MGSGKIQKGQGTYGKDQHNGDVCQRYNLSDVSMENVLLTWTHHIDRNNTKPLSNPWEDEEKRKLNPTDRLGIQPPAEGFRVASDLNYLWETVNLNQHPNKLTDSSSQGCNEHQYEHH